MDTNQQLNRQDNYQINTFTGGMNTDTSYDMVLSNLYLFGLNIRITNNTLISNDYDSNSKENIVCPVLSGKDIKFEGTLEGNKILATASIENVGAIITKRTDEKWNVYRADYTGDKIKLTKLFTSTDTTDKDRFSVVINKELEKHVKLYIADGKHQLMCIDLSQTEYYKNSFTEDDLISNHIYPTNLVTIKNKIGGTLKTQQLQYTYRFYRKYGINSKLAPITNKIQVIDSNRHKEIGNAYDTNTSIGFQLSINYDKHISEIFDHILIFRISYYKKHENAEINLICDNQISTSSTEFIFNDSGVQSLAQYSMDEFSALSGTVIKPQVIESNQGYMFAANIQDTSILRIKDYDPKAYQFNKDGKIVLLNAEGDSKTFNSINDVTENYYINPYSDINNGDTVDNPCKYDKDGFYGGTGKNISWRFITTDILLDSYPINNIKYGIGYDNVAHVYLIEYLKLDGSHSKLKSISDYYKEKNILCDVKYTYDDMFTSSMFRSLARDEVYRYGVVFYDKYGTRSDVLWIADIRTPNNNEYSSSLYDFYMFARPIGIEFKIKRPNSNIIGYLIVRCEKSNQYSKTIMQCALSRPIRQSKAMKDKSNQYRTPYYPSMLMSTQFSYITYSYESDSAWLTNADDGDKDLWTTFYDKSGTNVENKTLYQLFSPGILFRRQDELNNVSLLDMYMRPIYYTYQDIDDEMFSKYIASYDRLGARNDAAIIKYNGTTSNILNTDIWGSKSVLEDKTDVHPISKYVYLICKSYFEWNKANKISSNVILKYYKKLYNVSSSNQLLNFNSVNIKNIADVKNPTWEQGYSDILLSGSDVTDGIKQYKSYRTSIGKESYVNWICNGMYDIPLSEDEAKIKYDGKNSSRIKAFSTKGDKTKAISAYGWTGPGPVCFLAEVEKDSSTANIFNNFIVGDYGVGTIISNILHTAILFSGITKELKQYDLYYGFGNFGKFDNDMSSIDVFDGLKYITPCEFVNMFKTYNFNDYENSIQSGQVVYYIPLESDYNTYFDYGCNYRNTSSANLQLEPGEITGITSQDRPLHQYNTIYSDNDTSNDVFAPQTIEDTVETYQQRIYYSMPKVNGESIDNWHVFKPADSIDADTRYGLITDMLTVNDIIYFWLTGAFGKLSVNERSLITDNNSNTIQLGQGGVLQRTDYINTRYGMREQDFSAISAEDGVFWIDMINKTIVASTLNQAVNYAEILNVQNLVNKNIDIDTNNRPIIDYDLQNNELICKMFKDSQLVFSLKNKCAVSTYTRDYTNSIKYNNVLVGLKINKATKYNYLLKGESTTYLAPTVLEFVVNSSASQTKVFDNLKVVILKREYDPKFVKKYTSTKKYKFITDTGKAEYNNIDKELITDREGNICYAVPRENTNPNEFTRFGRRMRGKWMVERIEDSKPEYDYSISHIITKFRQSYS